MVPTGRQKGALRAALAVALAIILALGPVLQLPETKAAGPAGELESYDVEVTTAGVTVGPGQVVYEGQFGYAPVTPCDSLGLTYSLILDSGAGSPQLYNASTGVAAGSDTVTYYCSAQSFGGWALVVPDAYSEVIAQGTTTTSSSESLGPFEENTVAIFEVATQSETVCPTSGGTAWTLGCALTSGGSTNSIALFAQNISAGDSAAISFNDSTFTDWIWFVLPAPNPATGGGGLILSTDPPTTEFWVEIFLIAAGLVVATVFYLELRKGSRAGGREFE